MSNSPKVTAFRQTKQGPTRRADEPQDAPGLPVFQEVVAKWKPQMANVKDLAWSECPDEMIVDFVRASAGQIRRAYGEAAEDKASEVLGILLARQPAPQASITGQWAEAGARLELKFSCVDEAPSSAPEASFDVQVPEDASEEEVKEALGQWAEQPVEDHPFFDPASMLPAAAVRALLAQVENALGNPASTDSEGQRDVLMTTASFLLIWGKLDRRNAGEANFSLSGLTSEGEDIRPGQTIEMNMKCRPLAANMITVDISPDEADPALVSRTVRHRPS